MNQWSGYAALPLRLAVGAVFMHHGIMKLQMGIPGVTGFFHSVGIPFAGIFAVIVTALETVGGALVILGILTRVWGIAFAVEMVVAITLALLPSHRPFELEGMLLAGALSLVALGDGPVALGMTLKRG